VAKNYDNIHIYGDLESDVWVGDVGATLPQTLVEPAAPAFDSLGWLSEEGVSLAIETNVEKFRGWQGGSVLRTKVTSTDKSFTVQALEEKRLTTGLYFGHGDPVVTGTGDTAVARLDLPESIGTVARSAVVRFKDGGVDKFLCCEKVEVTERGELTHQNTSMTIYEFTFEIIGAAYILTNNPAYLPAV
jgi:hypothetical protein